MMRAQKRNDVSRTEAQAGKREKEQTRRSSLKELKNLCITVVNK